MENEINYIKGDATNPIVKTGTRVIAHICNDIGAWGSGFVLALSKKWQKPEREYRNWAATCDNRSFKLGAVQFVPVWGTNEDLVVVNMIAQHGCGWIDNVPPIRYEALESCLIKLANWLKEQDSPSVHMPRIGCGLAGGTWDKVEVIINKTLVSNNIPVYVYDL